MPSVMWFRRDLRRHDHPALLAAAEDAGSAPLVALYVIDPALWAGAGDVRRAWLSGSLTALDA